MDNIHISVLFDCTQDCEKLAEITISVDLIDLYRRLWNVEMAPEMAVVATNKNCIHSPSLGADAIPEALINGPHFQVYISQNKGYNYAIYSLTQIKLH